jgi:peroxiredoxin
MKKLLFIFILLPLFCLAADKADPKHKVKIGETAPEFTLKYIDGKTVNLSELKGKVIMLQFTASWCSVCNKEMPFIEKEIYQKNKNNKNFILVGIDFKEDTSKINSFVKKTGISYPLLLDEDGSIFEKYAEKDAGVTRNVIIDKKGKIVFLTRLFDKKEFNKMKKKIEELLK